jgi:lipoprotein
MKKLTKATILVLSAFAVTACFDKDKKVEVAPTQATETTNQAVKQEPAPQPVQQPVQAQAETAPKAVEVEQLAKAPEQVEKTLSAEEKLDAIRAEYFEFDKFKIKLEEGLSSYQEKLAALQQGQLDKEQAARIIEELSNFMKDAEVSIANYPLKFDAIKQVRDQTVKTISLSNNVLLNAVHLIVAIKENKEVEGQAIVDTINKQMSELETSAKKLDAMKEELGKILDL